MKKKHKKILISAGLADSLVNFRGELIKGFVSCGFEVVTASPKTNKEMENNITQLGCKFTSLALDRNGLNPFSDFKYLIKTKNIFNEVKPNYVLSYTIKPVIYSGLVSLLYKGIKFYPMITGLGYAFQKGGKAKSILSFLVKFLYYVSLKKSEAVIFQNRDNMQVFIDEGIVPQKKCFLVNGSGVDLSHYNLSPLPSTPHFLLIARLLGDKGIREYAQAAELVRQKYPDAVFELVGPEDPSPDGIKLEEIQAWCDKGAIVHSGATNDVRPFIENCSVYVLPSYHEGMPRTVLEAMAMGRPILTTDVPGCRETVVNGENGWLVEKANVEQLAERMIWFIENQDQWQEMGKASHDMAYEKFDVHKVNAEILKIMGLSNEKDF